MHVLSLFSRIRSKSTGGFFHRKPANIVPTARGSSMGVQKTNAGKGWRKKGRTAASFVIFCKVDIRRSKRFWNCSPAYCLFYKRCIIDSENLPKVFRSHLAVRGWRAGGAAVIPLFRSRAAKQRKADGLIRKLTVLDEMKKGWKLRGNVDERGCEWITDRVTKTATGWERRQIHNKEFAWEET